jgi:hypothetical protein
MANEKRLIDANALKNEMLEENPYIHFGPFGYCACSPKTDGELVFKREDVLRAIDSAPTVDAEPVVHGRWVAKETMIRSPFAKNYYCSECQTGGSPQWKRCPVCEAKMDGS